MKNQSLAPVFIGLIAVLFRLYDLDQFATIDELKWAEGAAQFLRGLWTGDFTLTYWHFHPGITITWGSALVLGCLCWSSPDILACADVQVSQLTDVLGWLRLSPVLWTTGGVVWVYYWGRKILNEYVAIMSSLFLAVDPFFVAHSRILNGDAIAGIFMFLSLLAFVGYLQHQQNGWVVGSAILGGLALSSKLPAPLLVIFVWGLVLLMLFRQPAQWKRWLKVWLGWSIGVGLTMVALWPALWVAPFETLQLMYYDAFDVGEVGAGHMAYFLGHISTDPGWLFYPYVIAFRLTPLVCVGLLLGSVSFLWQVRQQTVTSIKQTWVGWIFIGFVLFIFVGAGFSPKKLDRYVMSVIPALIVLSLMGLYGFFETCKLSNKFRVGLLVAMGLGQGYVAVQSAPYYLTFYNPLLGGATQAKQQVPVGWGEGLEQAAAYLNQQPQAHQQTVSAWYSDIFQPYFLGQRASFSDDGRGQLTADYVIFYINQIQRQKPSVGVIDYFRRQPPLFTLDISPWGKIITTTAQTEPLTQPHWVEVYRAPSAQRANGAPTIEGIATLLAYRVEPMTSEQTYPSFFFCVRWASCHRRRRLG